ELGPAPEPLPVRPDHADELVAAVDGDDPALAPASGPVDEQRLDVRLELAEHRVSLDEIRPRVQVELGLGRPRGRGIERDDLARRRAVEEEGELDRNVERAPECVVELEAVEVADGGRKQAEVAASRALV